MTIDQQLADIKQDVTNLTTMINALAPATIDWSPAVNLATSINAKIAIVTVAVQAVEANPVVIGP